MVHKGQRSPKLIQDSGFFASSSIGWGARDLPSNVNVTYTLYCTYYIYLYTEIITLPVITYPPKN